MIREQVSRSHARPPGPRAASASSPRGGRASPAVGSGRNGSRRGSDPREGALDQSQRAAPAGRHGGAPVALPLFKRRRRRLRSHSQSSRSHLISPPRRRRHSGKSTSPERASDVDGGGSRGRGRRQGGEKGAQGEEGAEGEEARRAPDLRRDDLGGDCGAQGEDGVELGGHRQVRGGEARREAAAPLQEAAGRAAEEAGGRGEADAGEELVQAGVRTPGRRRHRRQAQGRRQAEGEGEACRQAQRVPEGKGQGGDQAEGGVAQGQGHGHGRPQAAGPPAQGSQGGLPRQGGQEGEGGRVAQEGRDPEACRRRSGQEGRSQEGQEVDGCLLPCRLQPASRRSSPPPFIPHSAYRCSSSLPTHPHPTWILIQICMPS